MKNYFYPNEIACKIKQLINDNISSVSAKNITVGDFSVLPQPKDLPKYLPAVLINNDEIVNVFANESLNIAYTPYYYSIYYIYPYTFEHVSSTETEINTKKYINELSNVLMNFRTLDNFKIEKNDNEAGGLVVYSKLSNIEFDTAESEFFRGLKIPVNISKITFCVGFRTFSSVV